MRGRPLFPWLPIPRRLQTPSPLLAKSIETSASRGDEAGDKFPFTPRLLGQRLQDLKVLFLGSCQVEHMIEAAAANGFNADHVLYDPSYFAEPPALPSTPYDAIVVGLTLRTLYREALLGAEIEQVGNSWGGPADVSHARANWDERAAGDQLDAFRDLLDRALAKLREAVPSVPVLMFSFVEPSFAYDGLLIDPYGLTTMQGFVRAANVALAHAAKRHGFFFYDVNTPIAAVGRAYLQDDAVAHSTHASLIGSWDEAHDAGRLAPCASNVATFHVAQHLRTLHRLIYDDLADAVKILRQQDRVKLIVVDLDDTLWRGVAAEENVEGWFRTEGWPRGLPEALLIYKRRGGLLAICSKNDRVPTLQRLSRIWGDSFLAPQDFVSIKIDWRPKPDNIQEILQETNLLPESVVFIDDNPRELDEVAARFPTLRCLGGRHYDWRRIILRAPETQVANITAESLARTELVRATISRQAAAPAHDRRAWLMSLGLRVKLSLLADPHDAAFARATELLNKTNQFNTTGRRWTEGEIAGFRKAGGVLLAACLQDRHIDNGLICVAMIDGRTIVQVVLSCRVFGLGVERAVGAVATRWALASGGPARARFVDTGKNATCRNYFAEIGFAREGEDWVATSACDIPEWLDVTAEGSSPVSELLGRGAARP